MNNIRNAKVAPVKGGNVNTGSYAGNGAHLASAPDLYEIQRSNNFEFAVINANNVLGADAEEVITMSVTSASVPHFTQSVIEVKRGNDTIKYAGVPTFDAGSFTCNDYIGANTKEVLMAWQNKSFDIETRKVGLAEDYKLDCYLREFTPDYQLVRTWKLHGCWITGINEDNFDAESNGKKKITVNFVYDWAELDND